MTDVERELQLLTSQLEKHQVDEQGLSFFGRSLKLNNEEDAEIVAKEIDACDKLVFLNLDGNTVGIDAAKRISESLRKHGEFKRAIWKNMFTGRTKEEIPPALTHLGDGIIRANANLVELDLSDNAFGPIGVEGLQNLINSPSFHSLQELRLNNNGLGITGGKLLAKSLQKCYDSSQKKFALRVFQAGRNRLENPGAEALAKVFNVIGTLVEVSMPQNGIYAPGITALSEAFKNNPHLRILNFNDNTVQKNGAAALAQALPALQNLESLNLGDCLLKTEGAISIANALSLKHTSLKHLFLDHNEINIQGGIEVAKAMHNKSGLLTLDLNGNCFGTTGITQITKELQKYENDNALQSFSEDEDISGDENEATDSDEENGEDYSNSSDADDSSVLNDTAQSEDSTYPSVTVSEFLNTPSSKNFIDLGVGKLDMFIKYLETSQKEDFVKNSLELLFHVSNLCEHHQKNVETEAMSCALQLYKYLFAWANGNNKLSLVTNAILVQLGLIKAEEKKALIDCNPSVCLNVLKLAMKTENIIPEFSSDMINLFLNRKHVVSSHA